MRRIGARFAPVLALLAMLPGPAWTEELLEERAEARLHAARLRIESTEAAERGRCADLDVADLKVTLRGERIEETGRIRLDREPQPTLHALLIDTSGSMLGQLDYARRAAAAYVEQLRPGYDTALVATFDESVILLQPPTADKARLLRAIASIRMGELTSKLDALAYVIRELDGYRGRPVVLLLTDGVDTASLHERDDVVRLAEANPELTIFTIGLALPPLVSQGPAGYNSSRSFMQRLARRTNGSFFDPPVGSRLAEVYRRIRQMLEDEAILTVVDPAPGAEPGRLKVSSTRPGCRVRVLKRRSPPPSDPARSPIRDPPELPQRIPIPPDPMWQVDLNPAHHEVDPACAEPGLEGDIERLTSSVWFADVERGRVRGCVLDLTMETGMLYDPMSLAWWEANGWIRLRTRPIEIAVPPLAGLPDRPERALELLAEHALSVAGVDVEVDSRKRPVLEHARPYHDHPALVHGRIFLELRPRLARALYLHPDYRQWALGKLQDEARRELAALEAKLRGRTAGQSDAALAEAVRHSEEGRAILRRAETPSELELQSHLGAWLGDVPAHELFVAWESDRLDRRLADPATDPGSETFFEAWRELRRIFFAPSYARLLTLLSPVHDRSTDRIGFYRVVLPRAGWFQPRVKGYKKHPEWSNLPLDLVPDLPLGYWVVNEMLGRSPELAAHLREEGYRVGKLSYGLAGKPRKQNPVRGYDRTSVEVTLEPPGGPSVARLVGEVALARKTREPRLIALRIDADESTALAALTREARATLAVVDRR